MLACPTPDMECFSQTQRSSVSGLRKDLIVPMLQIGLLSSQVAAHNTSMTQLRLCVKHRNEHIQELQSDLSARSQAWSHQEAACDRLQQHLGAEQATAEELCLKLRAAEDKHKQVQWRRMHQAACCTLFARAQKAHRYCICPACSL